MILEQRDQLEIPFDGGEPSVHNKPWYVHFSDFIEKVGRTGSLKASKSATTLLRENQRMGVMIALEGDMASIEPVIGHQALVLAGLVPEDDDSDWDGDDVDDVLRNADKEKVADAICQMIDDDYGNYDSHLDDFVRLSNVIYDQDEYIEIFRVISPGGGWEDDEFKDEFLAAESYGGVGIYWAYEESMAQAYWTKGTDHNGEVLLRARVSPIDVDWCRRLSPWTGEKTQWSTQTTSWCRRGCRRDDN